MSTRVSVYWEGYEDTFYCLDGDSESTLKDVLGLYGDYSFDKEKHLSEDVVNGLDKLCHILSSRKMAYERAKDFVWNNPNFKFGEVVENLLDASLNVNPDFSPELGEDYGSDYEIVTGYIERFNNIINAIKSGKDVVAIYA